MPHSIDKDHWFCMGDNRQLSIDSRTVLVSDVSKNQIEGTIILRIWPLNKFRVIQ
ncbi:S26 family signal peptidase [uncultured Catenibacterium sp.]|nr:S26 family signal peptidase [uncultured Catenibacterium sp.]